MRQQRKINTFRVLYRISDNGNANKTKLPNATKIHCLENAIKEFKDAKIAIFIDGVIKETDDAIHKICDGLDNVELKYVEYRSDPKTLRRLYEEALTFNDDDFIYFLEDDYLHLEGSSKLLKEFAERNYTDYVTLYDHPDKYEEGYEHPNPYCKDFGEKTTVFRTLNHHWKITNSTTNTFAAFVDVLKRDKDIMWKNTSGQFAYDFRRFLELYENKIFLSSPIPSMSTHCEIKNLAPFINWSEI